MILCSFFDYGMAAQIAELPICRVIALFRTSSLTGEAYDIARLRADGSEKADEGHGRLVFVSNVHLRISFFGSKTYQGDTFIFPVSVTQELKFGFNQFLQAALISLVFLNTEIVKSSNSEIANSTSVQHNIIRFQLHELFYDLRIPHIMVVYLPNGVHSEDRPPA